MDEQTFFAFKEAGVDGLRGVSRPTWRDGERSNGESIGLGGEVPLLLGGSMWDTRRGLGW